MIYSPRWQHLYEIERRRIPPVPDGSLRLHRLERPVPWPDELWPRLHRINEYPNYPPLIKRIANWLHVSEDMIVLGQGIEDHVRSLIMLSCEPGTEDSYSFTWPTCAMFELYARIFNVKCTKIVTDPTYPPTHMDVMAHVKMNTKLLLLPNPGQPVQTCYNLGELRVIARWCKEIDCVFAIDEAYLGFGAPTALPLIHEFDNVVVLRTFSKAFGAAGIRVGYAVGQHNVVQPLDAIRLSGEIAGPSLRAANRLLARWPDIVLPGIEAVCAGRDWLRDKLVSDGFTVHGGTVANHVLIELNSANEARRVTEGLREVDVYVKGDFPPPLERHLLVTCGPLSIMAQFYDRFGELANEGKLVEDGERE